MSRLLFLSVVISFASCNQSEPAKQDQPAAEWTMVWQEEFDYTGLPDSSKWVAEEGGHGWGNNELQYYTRGRLENMRVENGMLTIEAKKENWEGKEFTSARLITRGKADWVYGKIEVRARLPKGRGTWPAIWMLGAKQPLHWPDDGEIDIMEHVGFRPGYIHASIHTRKYNHILGTQRTDTTIVNDFAENFHNYQLEWTSDSVIVSVDDQPFFRTANDGGGYEAWPFDNAMFLLLNIAVGGNWGGQQGVDENIWPQKMEVDYVRVWQRKKS
ncbi:MAG: family 16 glycosylhydrolase [Chitinophagaceae bacterium]